MHLFNLTLVGSVGTSCPQQRSHHVEMRGRSAEGLGSAAAALP